MYFYPQVIFNNILYYKCPKFFLHAVETMFTVPDYYYIQQTTSDIYAHVTKDMNIYAIILSIIFYHKGDILSSGFTYILSSELIP